MKLFRVKCRNCKKVLFECSKNEISELEKYSIPNKTIIIKKCPKCKEVNTYEF